MVGIEFTTWTHYELIWIELCPTAEFHSVVITTMIGSSAGTSATLPRPSRHVRGAFALSLFTSTGTIWLASFKLVTKRIHEGFQAAAELLMSLVNHHKWVIHKPSPVMVGLWQGESHIPIHDSYELIWFTTWLSDLVNKLPFHSSTMSCHSWKLRAARSRSPR